jgi:hypothetical protein
MTDNEPSSELRACVDIVARGRSSGRIALKSLPVVGAVVCASWEDVLTNYYSHLQFSMVEELKNQCVHFFWYCAKCVRVNVAGHARKTVQIAQMVCTSLGHTLCGLLIPKCISIGVLWVGICCDPWILRTCVVRRPLGPWRRPARPGDFPRRRMLLSVVAILTVYCPDRSR